MVAVVHAAPKDAAPASAQAENLRKMLLAMVGDIRVVITRVRLDQSRGGIGGTRLADRRAEKVESDPAYSRARIAVRMPCRSAVGVGGQPGTSTSTGITFETAPRLA